jgi:CHAD domain-containing protein
MKTFALHQISVRLRRLAAEVKKASASADADTVHDLRVAIRRFNRALRAFAEFLPAGAARKIRRRTKALMRLAAAVRDRDIARELLAGAEVPPESPIHATLGTERAEAEQALVAETRKLMTRHFSRKWKERLAL